MESSPPRPATAPLDDGSTNETSRFRYHRHHDEEGGEGGSTLPPPPHHPPTTSRPHPHRHHPPHMSYQTSNRNRPRRTSPPSQDVLVIVFVISTVVFTLISLSPFLLGDFASSSRRSSSSVGGGPMMMNDNNRRERNFLEAINRLANSRERKGGDDDQEGKSSVVATPGGGGRDVGDGEGGDARTREGGESEGRREKVLDEKRMAAAAVGGRGKAKDRGGAKRHHSIHNATLIITEEDVRGRTFEYVPTTGRERTRLDRGVSGLPSSSTPALVGARRGSIRCHRDDGGGSGIENDVQIYDLAYWNDPQGDSDVSFVSPFDPRSSSSSNAGSDGIRRYVTFEPDRGGWNNIRMSLEIVMVFAAATGRTLVLPPDTPFYLLSKEGGGKSGKEKKKKHHGFADFLDLDDPEMRKRLDMISMTEFLEMEGGGGGNTAGLFELPGGIEGTKIRNAAEQCYYIAKSDRPCDAVYEFLRSHAYVPDIQAGRECLIFDESSYRRGVGEWGASNNEDRKGGYDNLPDDEMRHKVDDFCDGRDPVFFGDTELASSRIVHFHAGEKEHRLLNHFYTFLFFTDARVDHHYKRFVRDFLHYPDEVFCAAGRVIQSLEEESAKLSSSSLSLSGRPSYSSMHVRRGDFQYKKVKITAQDWYDNTRELFSDNELIFIATDETSKEFFKPLAEHYKLRFLSDYVESAGLDKLDPNLMGMIDSIIASRGRLFVGTWFSTFTGYINRMRGYYGMPGYTSYYSTPDRKFNTHKWENPHKLMTAREWPTAWVGIDGDEAVSRERALKVVR